MRLLRTPSPYFSAILKKNIKIKKEIEIFYGNFILSAPYNKVQNYKLKKNKKMKTIKLVIVLALIPFMFIKAQNAGSLNGKVYDGLTKQPLIGCNVYIDDDGRKIGTITDNDGNYTLKPLPSGMYQVNYSYTGYNSKTVAANIFPGEKTFMKNISLFEGIIMDEAVVTAEKNDARLIDPGQINKTSLIPAEIKNIAGSSNPVMVIKAVSSEVQISKDGKDIVFRGSRNGSSACYIDGVKQANLSSTIPGCAIGSIVVYSGGIPAQYGDVTGGIIVLETKSYFDVRAQRRILESKKKDEKSIE